MSLPPLTVSPGKIREDLLTSLRVPAVENLAEQLPVRFPRPHIARERLLPSSRFLALLRKRDFRVVRRSTTAPPSVFKFSKLLNGFRTPKNLAVSFNRYAPELYLHGFCHPKMPQNLSVPACPLRLNI